MNNCRNAIWRKKFGFIMIITAIVQPGKQRRSVNVGDSLKIEFFFHYKKCNILFLILLLNFAALEGLSVENQLFNLFLIYLYLPLLTRKLKRY